MGREILMRYAWLEFHRGTWLLLTDDENEPAGTARKWMDEKTALTELADEGWTVDGPYPRRTIANVDPRLGFRGSCLTRVVQ